MRLRTAALAFLCVLACSGTRTGEPRPTPALASTPEAERDFAEVRNTLDDPIATRWQKLRDLLEAFLAKHPKDGLAPLARVYLAFALVEQGEVARARTLVDGLRDLPPGSTRDLWVVATARLLRLGGRPDRALDLVRPLVGKMVDVFDRELLLEETSLDAIDAQRHYEAVGYMDAWLRGVPEVDRDRVRARVYNALAQVPTQVLEATYRSMRAQRGATSGYSLEIQRLVAQRLAEVALERGDPNLARWLLDPTGGTPVPTGDAGSLLGELATSRRGIVTVQGRTIGLLLPTGNAALRDEAAEVVRGLSWALELPRTDPTKGDAVRLVTRSDYGDSERTESALEELAGEGAALVVAGFDGPTADRVLAWSDRTGLPVVSLALPRSHASLSHGFLLGESRRRELETLYEAFRAQGATKLGVVIDAEGPERREQLEVLSGHGLQQLAPVGCDVEAPRPGEPRFPFSQWAKEGVKAWVVSGPSDCTRDAMREAMITAPKGATVGVVLEGAAIAERLTTTRVLSVSAGVIPVRPKDVEGDPDLKAYVDQFGARPGWWTALGRDAGVLGRKAVQLLPLDTASTVMAVTSRRAAVEQALLAARSRLWTTEADGFKSGAPGARVLDRTLKIVELSPESRR
jgi:hypothetical protein